MEDHVTKEDFEIFQNRVNKFIEKAEPLIDAYNGAGALGKLVTSLGGIVIAIGAMYAGLMWLVHH